MDNIGGMSKMRKPSRKVYAVVSNFAHSRQHRHSLSTKCDEHTHKIPLRARMDPFVDGCSPDRCSGRPVSSGLEGVHFSLTPGISCKQAVYLQ